MSDHMKRLAAPRTWPLKRKTNIWITKQSPGPHSIVESMSAVTILRDIIGICNTAKEAKKIIGNRDIFVDGRPIRNPKIPIGFMDVISIPKTNTNYRMLLNDKGKLALVQIDKSESTWKLCKIENKTIIKGGKMQLNLSGGRNIIIDDDDYKCGDSIKVEFNGQNITDKYPLREGSTIMIKDGSQSGSIKKIKSVERTRGTSDNIIMFTDGTETIMDNCFVIGNENPEIKLPGGI